jgi:hypothetical protein
MKSAPVDDTLVWLEVVRIVRISSEFSIFMQEKRVCYK